LEVCQAGEKVALILNTNSKILVTVHSSVSLAIEQLLKYKKHKNFT